MNRLATSLVCLFACVPLWSAEPERVESVKKSAQELVAAILKGDHAKTVDGIYPKAVEMFGGREKMIKHLEDEMKDMKKQGAEITSCTIGDPGELHTEGNNTFAIVSENIELKIPKGKLIVRSYLLGISSDGGKTWKFVDGAGLNGKDKTEKDQIEKMLPKLPVKFKLPEKQKPVLIEDK